MAITDKNTIYSWFQTDDFPTEAQFRATWDSFWHKSESIPMSQITGLNELFNQVASVSQLNQKANKDGSNIKVDAFRLVLGIKDKTTTDVTSTTGVGAINPGDIVPAGTNIQKLTELLLNKTFYPTFAVTPFNLIPSCADCNKIKDRYKPEKPEEEIIHPYYDDISNQQYLFALVEKTTPASINFYIKQSNPINIIEQRLKKHFSLFALNELYASNAAEELSNISFRLSKLYSTGGIQCVIEYLKDEFESRYENNKNSWQTAMYEALYQNIWFCDGGFRID